MFLSSTGGLEALFNNQLLKTDLALEIHGGKPMEQASSNTILFRPLLTEIYNIH